MPKRLDDLADADVSTLVLETGRRLEQAVRKLVPDGVDAKGKPLTLGPRMRQLRTELGPEAWRAFEDWSRERNAYTHAHSTDLADADAFRQNFLLVERRLRQLAKPKPKPRAKANPRRRSAATRDRGADVLLGLAIAAALSVVYFSC